MKPFVKYAGGKSKEANLVIKYMPKNYNRYFEAFVGGGSIYFALENPKSYINDFSEDLISLYNCIKNEDKDFFSYINLFNNLYKDIEKDNFHKSYLKENKLYKKFYNSAMNKKKKTIAKLEEEGNTITKDNLKLIELTARKTAIYMLIRYYYNEDEDYAKRIASYYFLREYCYSSMFRFSKTGKFNVPFGGISYRQKALDDKINYIKSDELKNLLKTTVIENLDFEVFLNKYNLKEDDFLFLDPPYDSDFSTYDNNPFDKNEQIRLRDVLAKTKAKWMLIIKKTNFISDLYKEFYIYEYDKNYSVSFKNRNDRQVKHLLITNYEVKNNG